VEIPASPILCVGFDTETHLIGAGNLFPRLVCATFDIADEGKITPTTDVRDTYRAWVTGNADVGPGGSALLPLILPMFQGMYQHTHRGIIQNAAYDVCVLFAYCQDVISGQQQGDPKLAKELYMLMWDVLDQGLDIEMAGGQGYLHDTILRAKLFNLSTIGLPDVDKGGRDDRYGLSDLVKQEFDVDISGSKVTTDQHGRVFDHNNVDITGTPAAAASWRLRYSELDGIPTSRWPAEAAQYAIDDATWARKVYECQEARRMPFGYGSMNSEALQVYADVALRLYMATGFKVDRKQVEKVAVVIDEVMKRCDEGLKLNGIVRANGTVNTGILHGRIRAAWDVLGLPPFVTKTGAISASNETLEELAGVDPVIDLYAERAGFTKIKSSFLPNLAEDRVYSNYDVLKETGRTSSYGNSDKARRKPLYNAVNIQQIPRGDESKGLLIRECFLPPDPTPEAPAGYVICSNDYSALELCSVAQVTYNLFGYSVHRDKINQGYDLHSYLGSGMARSLAPHVVGFATEHEVAYKALVAARGAKVSKKAIEGEDPSVGAMRILKGEAGTWRNFAKPVGLGYPGGLGPKTLVTFAKTTYNVDITQEQAYLFRELWRQTYPEMVDYFKWVERQTDTQNGAGGDLYCYETQGFRRFRAAATFCATANGKCMQSLSADGAKRSVAWNARACFGGLPPDNPYAVLDGCLPLAFIHDENLNAIPVDDLLTVRSLLLSKLMVKAMQEHMPDVLIKVEPALMRRWTKAAEPEWKHDTDAVYRTLDALTRFGQERGVRGFADIVIGELGAGYDPTKVLVPWDDVYAKKSA
jgi:hypothetical protein